MYVYTYGFLVTKVDSYQEQKNDINLKLIVVLTFHTFSINNINKITLKYSI